MNTCKDCKHWTRRVIEDTVKCINESSKYFGEVRPRNGIEDPDWIKADPIERPFGSCQMANTEETPANPIDRVSYEYGEWGDDFYVGEDFGCIHFEQKA